MKSFNSEYRILSMIIITMLICVNSEKAFAQVDNNSVQLEKTSDDNGPQSELDIRLQKKVSIDVSSVPIEMVIKQLAEQVNMDFVLSPKVTGNVTVTLTDVSVEEALQSILDVHGYACIKGKNIIQVLRAKRYR